MSELEKAKARLEENGITVSTNNDISGDRLYIWVNDLELELSASEIEFQATQYDSEER